MNHNKVVLRVKGIKKKFPGVLALDNVDFEVKSGEIHALIGQNGAGKSTLVKILVGDLELDEGYIEINGQQVKITSSKKAIELGISIVYQELSLLPNLTVAENIYLGREFTKGIVINGEVINKKSKMILEQLGVKDIDIKSKVEDLSVVQQQLVEISKALSFEPRILILDEPTSSLTSENAVKLFRIMKNLREKGISIIYISHKINEIVDNCDRATILRDGRVSGVLNIEKYSKKKIIELMIGQSEDKFYHHKDFSRKLPKNIILEVENLSADSKLSDCSFELYNREILGITGVIGSGIYEIGRALFGVFKNVNGKIKFNNKLINIKSPSEALKNGIGLLTENKKKEGLFEDLSLRENITIPSLFKLRIPFTGLINKRKEKKFAIRYADNVNIIRHSIDQLAKTLSGGNQQKAIIAKWLLRELDIIIFLEPTFGVDIGAKSEIYSYLENLSQTGKGIIIVSIDAKEIMELSDRILVMSEGRIISTFNRGEVSEKKLILTVQGKGVKK